MEDNRKIKEALNRVQGLSAVASKDQVQSVMEVVLRCTLHLGDGMEQLSLDIHKAKEILGKRIEELTGELKGANGQISRASEEASRQTAALVKWTKWLMFMTAGYAVFTAALVIVTILTK
jgi:hypothetical protein